MYSYSAMARSRLARFPSVHDLEPADLEQEAALAVSEVLQRCPGLDGDGLSRLKTTVADRRMTRVLRYRLWPARDPRVDTPLAADEGGGPPASGMGPDEEWDAAERRWRVARVFRALRRRLQPHPLALAVLDVHLLRPEVTDEERAAGAHRTSLLSAALVARRLRVSQYRVNIAFRQIAAALVYVVQEGGDEDLVR